MFTKDDLKAIVDTISPLIDASAKTTETLIKGEIQSVREDVAASEERVSTRIEETKEELRTEMLAAQAFVSQHWTKGNTCYFCIVEGQDTAMLLYAYGYLKEKAIS